MADAKKMSSTKMWIIGLVALVILLGAMSLMQRNKIKKLSEAAKNNTSSSDSGMGGMETIVENSSTPALSDRQPISTDTPV